MLWEESVGNVSTLDNWPPEKQSPGASVHEIVLVQSAERSQLGATSRDPREE